MLACHFKSSVVTTLVCYTMTRSLCVLLLHGTPRRGKGDLFFSCSPEFYDYMEHNKAPPSRESELVCVSQDIYVYLPSEETHMGPEGLALRSGSASFQLVTGQGNPSALVSPMVDEDNGR